MRHVVKIELKNDRFLFEFEYDPLIIAQIKKVTGWKFHKANREWSCPNNTRAITTLRDNLEGWCEVHWPDGLQRTVDEREARAEELRRLSVADSADLKYLPELNPALYEFVSSRPYQLADIAYMAEADHCFNFNDPGTGKTVEAIGTAYESWLHEGPVLIIAPLTALEATWLDTLDLWLPGMPGYGTHPVVRHTSAKAVPGAADSEWVPLPWAVAAGPAGTHRQRVVSSALKDADAELPIWLVLNPESVRRTRQETDAPYPFPEIFDVHWNMVVVDEFHKMGLGESDTLMFQALGNIKTEKMIMMSGTPMGGRPLKLWPSLHLMFPSEFSAKWHFINEWFGTHGETVRGRRITKVDDIRKSKQDDFNHMLAEYMVRRRKVEVMPWLPSKQYIEKWVRLEGKQLQQYEKWEQDSEILIDETLVDAVSILAVYTRLRQFANCQMRAEGDMWDGTLKLWPEGKSAKFDMLDELLDETNISDPDTEDAGIVFSQFTQFINYISDRLTKMKIRHGVITGETTPARRLDMVRDFQAGKFDIMLMNTQAGGVSITLDRADTVFFLDETWVPDDQTQAEDRAHRGSKTRQVTIYRIFAKGTIDERISTGNISKDVVNARVLDNRERLSHKKDIPT